MCWELGKPVTFTGKFNRLLQGTGERRLSSLGYGTFVVPTKESCRLLFTTALVSGITETKDFLSGGRKFLLERSVDRVFVTVQYWEDGAHG